MTDLKPRNEREGAKFIAYAIMTVAELNKLKDVKPTADQSGWVAVSFEVTKNRLMIRKVNRVDKNRGNAYITMKFEAAGDHGLIE